MLLSSFSAYTIQHLGVDVQEFSSDTMVCFNCSSAFWSQLTYVYNSKINEDAEKDCKVSKFNIKLEVKDKQAVNKLKRAHLHEKVRI